MTINIGLISTARINKNAIISQSQLLDGVEVTKLFSRTEEKCISYTRHFNIKNYVLGYNDNQSYDDIHLAYISLPNAFHFEICKKILLLKKHVICEKPICFTYNEALELVNLAKKQNCFLGEGFHYKYFPQNIEIIENLQNENLGTVKYIRLDIKNSLPPHDDIRLSKKLNGGCLAHIGSYLFDFIGTLFEINQIKDIIIHKIRYENGIDIELKAQIKMDKNITIDIYSTFLSQKLESSLYVETDKNNFKFDNFFTPFSHDTYASQEIFNSYYFQLKSFYSKIKKFEFDPIINLNGMMFFEKFYKIVSTSNR